MPSIPSTATAALFLADCPVIVTDCVLVGNEACFVDPLGPDGLPGTSDEDPHLLPGSSCIDRGSNWLVPFDLADLDGDALHVGGRAKLPTSVPPRRRRSPRLLAMVTPTRGVTSGEKTVATSGRKC